MKIMAINPICANRVNLKQTRHEITQQSSLKSNQPAFGMILRQDLGTKEVCKVQEKVLNIIRKGVLKPFNEIDGTILVNPYYAAGKIPYFEEVICNHEIKIPFAEAPTVQAISDSVLYVAGKLKNVGDIKSEAEKIAKKYNIKIAHQHGGFGPLILSRIDEFINYSPEFLNKLDFLANGLVKSGKSDNIGIGYRSLSRDYKTVNPVLWLYKFESEGKGTCLFNEGLSTGLPIKEFEKKMMQQINAIPA